MGAPDVARRALQRTSADEAARNRKPVLASSLLLGCARCLPAESSAGSAPPPVERATRCSATPARPWLRARSRCAGSHAHTSTEAHVVRAKSQWPTCAQADRHAAGTRGQRRGRSWTRLHGAPRPRRCCRAAARARNPHGIDVQSKWMRRVIHLTNPLTHSFTRRNSPAAAVAPVATAAAPVACGSRWLAGMRDCRASAAACSAQ